MVDSAGYIERRAELWIQDNYGVDMGGNSPAIRSMVEQYYPGGWDDFRAHLIEGMKV